MKRLMLPILFIFGLLTFIKEAKSQDCSTDYKNLTGGNITALNQKIKTCGCPTKVYRIEEYAVYKSNANSVGKAGGSGAEGNIQSVILRRSGWAYNFSNCARARFWSDTNSDGVVYKQSTESVDSWVGKSINGQTVTRGFGVEW